MKHSFQPYVTTIWFFVFSLTLAGMVYLMYLWCYWNWHNSAIISGADNTSHKVYLKLLLLVSLTFFWYSISISFTVYNKWIMQSFHDGDFNFPITTTFAHMIVKFFFSRVWAFLFFPGSGIQPVKTEVFTTVIIPIGLATALDIVMSNIAVSTLTISLYTALKTTVVGWTFLLGCLFGVEMFSFSKLLTVILLMSGLTAALGFMDVRTSTLGIAAGLTSALCGGGRWIFVQMLIYRDEASRNPCVALYRFSLISVLTVAPLVYFFELQPLLASPVSADGKSFVQAMQLIMFGGLIACVLIVVEINLLNLTSSLTLSILGELKEVIQIILGMMAFHDALSYYSGAGVAITLLAAEVYRRIKANEKILGAVKSDFDYESDFEYEMVLKGADRLIDDGDDETTSFIS